MCECVWGGAGELFKLLTILLGVCGPLVLYIPSNCKEEPLDGGLRCIVLCFEAVFNLTKFELVPISGA